MLSKARILAVLLCSVLAIFVFHTLAVASDELPQYTPAGLDKQTLTSVGSDSMGGLMQRWIERYRVLQPHVEINATSRGSASAPPALIEGSADLGPMARSMKSMERRRFLNTYGFEPTQIQVAFAAVAVYVPVQSPIKSLSLSQLARIFSASDTTAPPQFKDLGVSDVPSGTLQVYGQLSHPYLAGYFRQKALLQKEFHSAVTETASPQALFQMLESTPNGIGFAAADFKHPDSVRMLAVSTEGEAGVLPSRASIASGDYPLSRSLNIYIAREPNAPLDASLQDFLRFVLSAQGQSIVNSQGLIALSAQEIQTQQGLIQ